MIAGLAAYTIGRGPADRVDGAHPGSYHLPSSAPQQQSILRTVMLEKTYQPATIEPRIHEKWDSAEAFKCGRAVRDDVLGEP